MPSVNKPQATLMALAAHNPAFAKKRGIPSKVAKDFNQADARTGILKRGAGGGTPNESGMNAKMNFGQGHGHSLFSTMPLLGHAMSGTQLGQADNTIRNAHRQLARFAEGGSVKKPAGPSAKERREIRELIEQGKQDAVATLRTTRDALSDALPSPAMDFTPSLDKLNGQLAMKDGGAVSADAESPARLYEEYQQLIETLHMPHLEHDLQMEIVDRLADLEKQLEGLGINVGEAPTE